MAPDSSASSSCFKLLGCGCAFLVLLFVFSGLGGWWWFRNLAESADESERILSELNERYGALGQWTPPSGWTLVPERLEGYLRVRQATMEACEELSSFFEQIEELDRRTEEGDEPNALEALGIVRPALRLPGAMTRYVEQRNRRLAEERMGLGEYAFLHVLALHSGPAAVERPKADRSTFDDTLDGSLDDTLDEDTRRAFVAALAAIADATSTSDPELSARLEADLERLERDAAAVPFPDGLPEGWAPLVKVRRERLEEVRCPAAEEIALAVVERRGPSIHID